jgi:isopentenyl diphosphate isomerase/L-lactate dehydrogenase-like FMN-dependent dehydrogenase
MQTKETMATENQHRAFISYSHVNRDFATKLAKGLKAAGYPVWFDQLNIPAGASRAHNEKDAIWLIF